MEINGFLEGHFSGGFLNVLCTAPCFSSLSISPLQAPVSVSSVARVPQSPLVRMEARLEQIQELLEEVPVITLR